MMCLAPGVGKEILDMRRPWERACDILDRTLSCGDYHNDKIMVRYHNDKRMVRRAWMAWKVLKELQLHPGEESPGEEEREFADFSAGIHVSSGWGGERTGF